MDFGGAQARQGCLEPSSPMGTPSSDTRPGTGGDTSSRDPSTGRGLPNPNPTRDSQDTWGQGLLQLLSLLLVGDDQGVEVPAAAYLKLHIVLVLLDLDSCGVEGTAGTPQCQPWETKPTACPVQKPPAPSRARMGRNELREGSPSAELSLLAGFPRDPATARSKQEGEEEKLFSCCSTVRHG